jgi:uncharacterized membrane protein HdeD (DUF308 family)
MASPDIPKPNIHRIFPVAVNFGSQNALSVCVREDIMPDRSFDHSWPALVRGAVAILFGIMLLYWPAITLDDMVFLFGCFAITHGAFTTTLAFSIDRGSKWFRALFLQTVADVLLGVFALLYPADDLWTLFLWIPAWAIVMGVLQIAYANQSHRSVRKLLALSGATQLLFGALVLVLPLSVVGLTGICSLLFGVILLGVAFQAHKSKTSERTLSVRVPHVRRSRSVTEFSQPQH